MKLQKAVAMRVCDLLIKSNLSRYAFCKNIGMPEQTLKHILHEEYKSIKLSTIAKIAYGFDLSIEEFFKDTLFKKENLDWE